MPFTAEAQRTIAAPPELCVETLRDHASWPRWMPQSFRPVSGPQRALTVGDVFGVRIAGVPVPVKLRVSAYAPGREVAWSGGIPGVLGAVHAFEFSPDGDGTRVRSVERWSGALAEVGPVARTVRRLAEKIGREQIDALARAVADRIR